MTRVVDFGGVSTKITPLKEVTRDEFKQQAFELTKRGIKFEVERDARQWPVSVTFKKRLAGSRLQIHVTREQEEPEWGLTQDDNEKVLAKYKIIQGGIEYEWQKNEVCGGYFSHQIHLPIQKLDLVKEIIFDIDKEPKTQLFRTMELLIPEVIVDINRTKEGILVTENPWYVEKGSKGIEIMGEELKRMLQISTKIMQELV